MSITRSRSARVRPQNFYSQAMGHQLKLAATADRPAKVQKPQRRRTPSVQVVHYGLPPGEVMQQDLNPDEVRALKSLYPAGSKHTGRVLGVQGRSFIIQLPGIKVLLPFENTRSQYLNTGANVEVYMTDGFTGNNVPTVERR